MECCNRPLSPSYLAMRDKVLTYEFALWIEWIRTERAKRQPVQ